MMPSSPIHHRTETYHSGRLSTGGARPPNTSPAALRSALASLPAIRHDEGRRHDHRCLQRRGVVRRVVSRPCDLAAWFAFLRTLSAYRCPMMNAAMHRP